MGVKPHTWAPRWLHWFTQTILCPCVAPAGHQARRQAQRQGRQQVRRQGQRERGGGGPLHVRAVAAMGCMLGLWGKLRFRGNLKSAFMCSWAVWLASGCTCCCCC